MQSEQTNEYRETTCSVTIDGKVFEAQGAVITDDFVIGYPAASPDGLGERLYTRYLLTDWHGSQIGFVEFTHRWKTPNNSYGLQMFQAEAYVNGKIYKGRTHGFGMVLRAKLSKGTDSKITKHSW